MRLVTAVLAKDEGGPERYLRRVLDCCLRFSTTVLLLDDSSTDDTRAIALERGVKVSKRPQDQLMWGRESPARSELWDWGVKEARDGWLLICDADMILHGDPRPLCYSWDLNAWAWGLYDLWDSETTYRVDNWWQYGPLRPRPWLVCPSRVPAGWTPEWPQRGIHCGHLPSNFPMICGVAPPEIYWLHEAYRSPEHRKQKHAQYMQVADQLTAFEREHASSVLD